jgi:ribosomal protein L29
LIRTLSGVLSKRQQGPEELIAGFDALKAEVVELREQLSSGGVSISDRLERIDQRLASLEERFAEPTDAAPQAGSDENPQADRKLVRARAKRAARLKAQEGAKPAKRTPKGDAERAKAKRAG